MCSTYYRRHRKPHAEEPRCVLLGGEHKCKPDTVTVQEFGVHSIYYGRHRKPHAEELGAKFQPDLDKFLGECDVITINCPLTDKTRWRLNINRRKSRLCHDI